MLISCFMLGVPDDMKNSMRKDLYDFYIRMIEIRRKYEASKTAQ